MLTFAGECKKAAKILASFVDPNQSFGPDKIIPHDVLARAKGLAVFTIIKAGFLGSARFGSGLVIARQPDGTWSAPSAVATGGAGFGGQIGFELTDFVFILNDANAVRSFSQAGSVTLGGNVSIAAGPVGRNAEAAGAASLKGVAGVFAYSKTKGLFAGVSLEGSVLVERKDANEKMYGRRVTASQLLGGSVTAPIEAEPLMRILNSRAFAGVGGRSEVYNDSSVYGDEHDDVGWQDRQSATSQNNRGSSYEDRIPATKPAPRTSTWQDDVYDREPAQTNVNRAYTTGGRDTFEKPKAAPPKPPKPNFGRKADQAIAKFAFDGEQDGDLSFRKGDIIEIVKKTDNETDWWTGRVGSKEGIFPR
jgi:SH3 domain-containing YSC84-like protein 1